MTTYNLPTVLPLPDASHYFPMPGGHAIVSPATILGAAYHSHFRADDPFRLVSGGNVVGAYNYGLDASDALQADPSKGPAYSATSFNGGPGWTFDGVDDVLVSAFNGAISAGARPYMFLVGAFSNPTGVDIVGGVTAPTPGDGGFEFYTQANTLRGIRIKSSGVFDTMNSAVATGATRRLIEIGMTSGGTASLVVGGTGTDAAHDYTSDAALTKLFLGDEPGAGLPQGFVFAHAVLAASITTQQLTDMRTWFNGPNFANYPGSSLGL